MIPAAIAVAALVVVALRFRRRNTALDPMELVRLREIADRGHREEWYPFG